MTSALDFDRLREANTTRQAEWDTGNQITLAYRGNELAGEVGEACNVLKKIERERLGIRGSRATLDDLASELADVIICADLIAMGEGIDLGAAVVAKFNATSEKVGLATRIDARLSPAPVGGETDGYSAMAARLICEADIVHSMKRRGEPAPPLAEPDGGGRLPPMRRSYIESTNPPQFKPDQRGPYVLWDDAAATISDLEQRLAEAARQRDEYRDRYADSHDRAEAAERDLAEARKRNADLEAGLRPFASIMPSTAFPEDGSEAEPYTVVLSDPTRLRPDFTGLDLANARALLTPATDKGEG